jgi:hypothetical protein
LPSACKKQIILQEGLTISYKGKTSGRMLERHAINVSIVEVDDHLTRKSGDDPAL